MPEDRPSLLVRLFRGLDGLRRFLVNVLFFGLLVAAGGRRLQRTAEGARRGGPRRPARRARSSSSSPAATPSQRLVAESAGVGSVAKETLLKDLLDAIRAAKDDKRIKALYLDVDDMSGGGHDQAARPARGDRGLQEERQEGGGVLRRPDAGGSTTSRPRPTRCTCTRRACCCSKASAAGATTTRKASTATASTCTCSASASTSRRSSPTSATTCRPRRSEMSLEFYGDLWRVYLADVAEARKIRPEDITSLIDAMPDRLRAAGGDMAKLALDAKLVDKLAPRDEVRQRLIELVGEDEEKKSFRQIGVADVPAGEGRRPDGRRGQGPGGRGRGRQGRRSSTAPSPRARSAATRPRASCAARARTTR